MSTSSAPLPQPTYPSSPSDLVKYDTRVGTGRVAETGNNISAHYTGWLFVSGGSGAPGSKGKQFDSSRDRDKPITFRLGDRRVIAGWEQGVPGMRVGGKRTLLIPPSLAYGERNIGDGLIPPGSTLVFEIELLAVE